MAILVSRDKVSTDFILRITNDIFCGEDKFEVVSKIMDNVCAFLVKEYVKQHRQEILAQIDPQAIINTMAVKIAEQITTNLLEKK